MFTKIVGLAAPALFIVPIMAAPQADSVADAVQAATIADTGPGRALDTSVDQRTAAKAKRALAAIIDIDASSESNRASLKFAKTFGSSRAKSAGRDVEWTTSTRAYSLIFSAPLNKSNPATDLITTGQLPSDFQAKIGFSDFSMTSTTNIDAMDQMRDRAKQNCLAAADHDHKKQDECRYANGEDLVQNYLSAEDLSQYVAQPRFLPFLIGAEASVGYQKFDFLDAIAAKQHQTKVPWSVKAYGGLVPWGSLGLFRAGIEYQDAFKASASGTLCPLGTGPVLTCSTGSLGGPKRSEKLIVSGEYRQLIGVPERWGGWAGLKAIGLDLGFSYDTKSDVYGFDLPLSIVLGSTKSTVAGVRLGWQSDDHHVIAGVFLGSALSLFD